MNEIPVVLITYNRPWHTQQVLEALRKYNVKNIYIFSDAPKTEQDAKRVSDTRNLLSGINWTVPKIKCQDENIGLARSIVSAVNTVFKTHDKLILLEDDCVPHRYFFNFMHECLERYKNSNRIFGVTGYSLPIPAKILSSYQYDNFFIPRICSWGWGTWKRAWGYHSTDLKNLFDTAVEKSIDLSQGGNDIPYYIESMLQGNLEDVWTLNWQLTVYLHNGCFIHPTRTHISNIGMDGSGVHHDTTDRFFSTGALEKPSKFADDVFYNNEIVQYYKSFYDNRKVNALGSKVGHAGSWLKNGIINLFKKTRG